MSFGSITTASGVYSLRANGSYMKSTDFGNPEDEFKLTPNTNKKLPSVRVVRSKQIDYTIGAGNTSVTKRINATVTVSINIPAAGFPVADVDAMVGDIAEFITPGTLTRMLQGES